MLQIYVSMSTNLFFSGMVILINAVLLYLLHIKMIAATAIDDSSARFQEGIKAADFARMPIIGVLLLAELANISYDEVVREYEKDSMERRAIVYDIFGQNSTIRKFVDDYPSQFLRNGYDGESQLLMRSTATVNTTTKLAPSAIKMLMK